ncbi:CG0192-related protein [Pseudonocardia sichuanensis]
MALIHRARITPTKAELLGAWLPSRPWSGGAASAPFALLGAYRFDDPAGEVGIETHLVGTAGGDVVHVPLTYRGAPLVGADAIGTMEHSHLGHRWVYDGCDDPVYVAALATAILTGGRQAEEWVEQDTGREQRPATAQVAGSGTPGTPLPVIEHARETVRAVDGPAATTIGAWGRELVVLRAPGATASPEGAMTLTGSWPGSTAPSLLAFVRP